MSDAKTSLIRLPGCPERFVRLPACPFCSGASVELMDSIPFWVKCNNEDCRATGPVSWAACSALLADLDDQDEWCVCRKDNPDIALCGAELEGVVLPDAEVPDELTCPECRRIFEESVND